MAEYVGGPLDGAEVGEDTVRTLNEGDVWIIEKVIDGMWMKGRYKKESDGNFHSVQDEGCGQ